MFTEHSVGTYFGCTPILQLRSYLPGILSSPLFSFSYRHSRRRIIETQKRKNPNDFESWPAFSIRFRYPLRYEIRYESDQAIIKRRLMRLYVYVFIQSSRDDTRYICVLPLPRCSILVFFEFTYTYTYASRLIGKKK